MNPNILKAPALFCSAGAFYYNIGSGIIKPSQKTLPLPSYYFSENEQNLFRQCSDNSTGC